MVVRQNHKSNKVHDLVPIKAGSIGLTSVDQLANPVNHQRSLSGYRNDPPLDPQLDEPFSGKKRTSRRRKLPQEESKIDVKAKIGYFRPEIKFLNDGL